MAKYMRITFETIEDGVVVESYSKAVHEPEELYAEPSLPGLSINSDVRQYVRLAGSAIEEGLNKCCGVIELDKLSALCGSELGDDWVSWASPVEAIAEDVLKTFLYEYGGKRKRLVPDESTSQSLINCEETLERTLLILKDIRLRCFEPPFDTEPTETIESP